MKSSERIVDRLRGQVPVGDGFPPLDLWHPELCGDIDIRITREGVWLHQGVPIAREAIVRLFASILRREEDGSHYLVSPVEKWRVVVDDTALVAHNLQVIGAGETQVLSVSTNMGETLEISESHPLTVASYPGGEPKPVVLVRNGLQARVVTSAYYEIAELAETREQDGETVFGVMSHGKFWKIG